MKDNPRLALALAHAGAGREVFPFSLMPPDAGGRRAKVPKVKWTQEATTDEEAIRGWWRRWPLAMPGWRLPPGVVVVDVDDPAAFEEAGLELDIRTATQLTPRGGYHLAFTYDPSIGEPPQTVKEIEGADTRVGGKGWVGLYEEDSFAQPMKSAPAFLYERRERAGGDEPIGEEMGTRDEILRWVGKLRREGRTASEILALLMVARDEGRIVSLDEARPWEDKDLRAIAREAGKWEAGPSVDTKWLEDSLARWKKRARRRPEPQEAAQDDEQWFVPLADVDPTEPRPLALGFIDPEEHSILFGDGGTGKGMVAAWWIAQLSRDGLVFVLDYEAHARFEWRPRVERFGGEMGRVFIAQPGAVPIWSAGARVREEIEEIRQAFPECPVWLVVDSVSYACIGAAVEDSTTAIRYSSAVSAIGLPTLSLAHTTKADADPKHPFGSVFWSNGARVTIGMTGTRQDPWRRLENKKTNQRGYFPTVELDWSWAMDSDGGIPRDLGWKVLDRAADDGSDLRGANRAVLEALVGALPLGMTYEELSEATGTTVRNLQRVLPKLEKYKRVVREQAHDGGPVTWRAVQKEGFERASGQGGDEG